MQIKAAVARTPHAPLSIEQVELDDPGPGEVLVRMVATGVCHTDVVMIEGGMPLPFPIVLGHEGSGVVERIGAGVEGLAAGDHVVLAFGSCGTCERCDRGLPSYCDHYHAYNFLGNRLDGGRAIRDVAGAEISSFFFSQSSFGAYALARARNTIKVRKDVPLELLGPLGCGVATGAGAVFNVLKPSPEAILAVFGIGALGTAAIMAAHYLGVRRIIAVDRHANRLEMARALGATEVINTELVDLESALKALGGLDYAIDTTGAPALLEAAVDNLRSMGTLLVLSGGTGKKMCLPVRHMVSGRKVIGVVNGDSNPAEFIPRLVDLYVAGQFPFDKVVKFYDFERINQAIEDSTSGVTIKPVVVFS